VSVVRHEVAFLNLLLQKGEHLDVLAVAFGVGGVPLCRRNVIGDSSQFADGDLEILEQCSVHDEVGVATNRGSEVRILFLRETVVAEGFDRVARLHQRLEKADFQGGANRKFVESA